MPSSLSKLCSRGAWLALLIGGVVTTWGLGCRLSGRSEPGDVRARAYPPTPQIPRVIALGTLRGAPPPTSAQTELALFFFGAEPAAPLAITNPNGLTAADGALLVCDPAMNAVFRWDPTQAGVRDATPSAPWEQPFSVAVAPDGALVVCDRRGVWRWDGHGQPRQAFAEQDQLRAADVLMVGDDVWITNQAVHRIESFDYVTGEHRGSIGRPGTGPLEFAFPRGMARTPDGKVCIVDMLNNRVQIVDQDGHWLRNIGQAGDTPGTFGRPRDVAVGPDGTIFVTDAFSQRVHAFAPDGEPLLSFGEPGSGRGALCLPNGIAITTVRPPTEIDDVLEEPPAYYVLVAEQIVNPGVRVYAWLGGAASRAAAMPYGEAVGWQPQFPQSAAINPHWHPDRCATCHENEALGPLTPPAVDRLCLSCHDGVQAPADPHPIGRPAVGERVRTPPDWPTVGGLIGCLTCHDIKRHCDPAARRPAVNYVLLRGYDAQQPLAYCANCHPSDAVGRFSPHRQRDEMGQPRDEACLFCHTRRPDIPPDGRRRFQPLLRVESSALCLNCHSPHWDLSPRGHVDRPVPPQIREWMSVRELSRETTASPDELLRMARASERPPAWLPLGAGKVTCYTCHNPHYTGLFPPDSELGALASNPTDRVSALRTDWIELCSECHRR